MVKDPGSIERPFNYTGKVDWKKLRIAYPENYFRGLLTMHLNGMVIDELRHWVQIFRSLYLPDSIFYPFNIIGTVLSAESAAAFDELTRSNQDDLIRQTG